MRAVAAARPKWAAAAGWVAEALGHATRTLPGVGGALLISYGLGLAWLPLGFVAAGVFLLALDRRIQ